jgi:hypothetical protein
MPRRPPSGSRQNPDLVVRIRKDAQVDRGPDFDGVRIGRPAVGGLIEAGFSRLDDLPDDLDELKDVHGVGPKAIGLLREARADRPA